MLFFGVVDRPDGQQRAFFPLQCHTGVQGFALRAANQVNAACPGCDPARPVGKIRYIVRVFPRADADLTQVIHTRPDEIAQQARFVLGQLIKTVGIAAERLASDNQAVRVFFQVMLIPAYAIIVPRGVHICKGIFRFPIARRQGCPPFHKVRAHETRQVVEELAADGLFPGGRFAGRCALGGSFGLFLRLVIAVNTKAH